MIAEILTIGDELLRGEIVDSNKTQIAERLLSLGVETRFQISVRDAPADMAGAFCCAAKRADVVIVSGGLGPTRDDLTSEVIAETFGHRLSLDETVLASLRAFFDRLGRPMAENNRKQAYFPEGAEVLPNPIGTAPGFSLEAGGSLFFCLPGVPRELARMLDEQVLPRLAARRPAGGAQRSMLLRTFGISESALDLALRDVALPKDVTLGFRTAFPDNLVRVVARSTASEKADAALVRACTGVREHLGAVVYGEGEPPLAAVVGELLAGAQKSLAVAESCTGGLLAERIAAVAGASRYFRGGVVTYSNAAKCALLGVPEALLSRHGAVSEPVARAMAEAARERFGADFALATTGISGPTGGSPEKPVGTLFLALAAADGTHAAGTHLPFERERHRQATAQLALDWLRRKLLGLELTLPRSERQESTRH